MSIFMVRSLVSVEVSGCGQQGITSNRYALVDSAVRANPSRPPVALAILFGMILIRADKPARFLPGKVLDGSGRRFVSGPIAGIIGRRDAFKKSGILTCSSRLALARLSAGIGKIFSLIGSVPDIAGDNAPHCSDLTKFVNTYQRDEPGA
jgi:hypothetical protein